MAASKKPKINNQAPYGWFLAGSHPFEYRAALDTAIRHSGTRSCCVMSNTKTASGWTTLMQNMGPAPYLNKRLRMTFWVRTHEVGYISGWMRIDGRNGKDMLAFDNMCDRKLEGTHDWIKQEIVLSVPEESTNIGFGVIFSGTGTMWVDDFAFEVVDCSVSETSCPCSPHRLDFPPRNLNFESEAENGK
jgi:hypothetical protein